MLPWFACGIALMALRGRAGEVTSYYEVTLNDQKVTVAGGATTNVVVGEKRVRVGARETEFKKFNDGNISFLFPAGHAVQKEDDPAFTSWTLDGQDNVMMIYRLKELDASEFCGNLKRELEKKYGRATRSVACECSFGTNVLKGTRITARLIGETIVQEVYSLPACKGEYVFLIQDSGETPTPEARLVRDKLKETFSCQPAASH